MPKTYHVSEEDSERIEVLRKDIQNKKIDKRLWAVQLRGQGMKNEEIANKIDVSSGAVSHWVSIYCNEGLEALTGWNFGGNRRNMSYEEELAFLEPFCEKAATGQMVEVSEIKETYERAVKHKIGSGQIYRLLKRHGWRKVIPRSKHPNKASDEAIEASKKLTQPSERRWQILPPGASD